MSSYCADQADWVQLGPVSCAHTHARTFVCVCWSRFALQQDAYTGGMSIPFVGPWEQSSISLLGTALMRPGILPFIPHSLQLGTAHSFRYGHSKVFVYTETMQLARAAPLPNPHTPPLRSGVRARAIPAPRIPAQRGSSGFRGSVSAAADVAVDVVFVHASSSPDPRSARECQERSYVRDLQIELTWRV